MNKLAQHDEIFLYCLVSGAVSGANAKSVGEDKKLNANLSAFVLNFGNVFKKTVVSAHSPWNGNLNCSE